MGMNVLYAQREVRGDIHTLNLSAPHPGVVQHKGQGDKIRNVPPKPQLCEGNQLSAVP
jgi:hypothetical protein